ncbi:hypothetical protein CI105_05370 [Candidatus Izimaplasma bacterium ZiA1]|uniref:transporter substrate-binding domain-containing protein n=1 Tax=Candidatus Izimoplasma sp. ZiA1 TaxID=2024899 RepID=UPI000BAA7CCE|nr:hypothetical protein CI105_05370 [Candidatus Izimaplasma bacterium ZiA1]
MKKIFVLFTALVLVFTLSACNKDEGKLRVGMDLRWPPFETIKTDGTPSGISVDVAYALGEYLGREVEIVNLEFAGLITALNTEDIDIVIASMSITDERKLSIDFTDPYFYFPLLTVVHKDTGITTLEDLLATPDLVWVGPKSFVSLTIPLELATDPIIMQKQNASAALFELTSGNADAFIISASSAVGYHNDNPTITNLIWDPIMYSPIGMGVKKGNDELLEKANEFINGLEENGIYDELRLKYDSVIAVELPGQGLDFYLKDEE